MTADIVGARAGDPSGALDAVGSTPEQVRGAAAAADAVPSEALPEPGAVREVLFCGMGGSGVGGDLLAALAASAGHVPVVVHRSYAIPAFCGPDTFVIASSYSGETEETIDAFRAAVARGARGVAVTSGGTLAREAHEAGWAVAEAREGLMPRYAIGWMCGLPVAVAARTGLVELADGWADRLVVHLGGRVVEWGTGAGGAADDLAADLEGAVPVVWGAEGVTAVAATRWKNDLNENAEVFAHAASLPELDHNEIVGWAATERGPGRRALVCLREPDPDPRIAARFRVSVEEAAGAFDLVRDVEAAGPDPLTRFFDLALLGGFVSVYLAIRRGVDPTPVDAIARLKAALARTPDA